MSSPLELTRCVLTALNLGLCAAQMAVAQSLPNICSILPDNHGWEDHGFMGHPVGSDSQHRQAGLGKPALHARLRADRAVSAESRDACHRALSASARHHRQRSSGAAGASRTRRDGGVFRRNKTMMALLREKGYVSFQSGKWWEGNPLEHGFTSAMTHGDPARGGRHGDEGLNIGRRACSRSTTSSSRPARSRSSSGMRRSCRIRPTRRLSGCSRSINVPIGRCRSPGITP